MRSVVGWVCDGVCDGGVNEGRMGSSILSLCCDLGNGLGGTMEGMGHGDGFC